MTSRIRARAWLPVASAVTAWTALVASAAPAVPVTATTDGSNGNTTDVDPSARDAADGTFESCSAYFGFGKHEFGVIDVVDFDVADRNGDDGVDHSVETDTPVVLVLENEDGDVLECTPVEVTEQQWNDAMADTYLDPDSLPAWPGPGHYAYPSVPFHPTIDDFGTVTEVGFRVVDTPDENHTLVAPVGVKPLVQHHVDVWDPETDLAGSSVADLIASRAGDGARDAYVAAFDTCAFTDDDVETDANLIAAMNVLLQYRDYSLFDPDDPEVQVYCSDVTMMGEEVAFVLGTEATITYHEPIVLALPEVAPTTSPVTTLPPSTLPPSSEAPTTVAPTTVAPSSVAPTTSAAPTSSTAPTTAAPSIAPATTSVPTTTVPKPSSAPTATPVSATPAYTG